MRTTIKKFRQLKGLTQQELADMVRVRRETVVFLEKGTYNPSLQLAHDVSRVLGTRIEELFLFEE